MSPERTTNNVGLCPFGNLEPSETPSARCEFNGSGITRNYDHVSIAKPQMNFVYDTWLNVLPALHFLFSVLHVSYKCSLACTCVYHLNVDKMR